MIDLEAKCAWRPVKILVVVGLLFGAGCSNSAASAPTFDAFIHDEVGAGDDGGAQGSADAAPQGCAATYLVPGTSTSCRVSWKCDDGSVFTYACGDADGGALCYCVAGSRVTVVTGGVTPCGQDQATLLSDVPGICQWDFLVSLDGGQT